MSDLKKRKKNEFCFVTIVKKKCILMDEKIIKIKMNITLKFSFISKIESLV